MIIIDLSGITVINTRHKKGYIHRDSLLPCKGLSLSIRDMRVLGIDPGYGRFGWAILEGNKAEQHLIACGCEETKAGLESAQRYLTVLEKLEALLKEFKPESAAVETIFYFKNAKTVIKVSESRGVVVMGLARARVEIHDYSPLQVKQAVTGYGRAEKKQVQTMVKQILHLEVVPRPDDAADAVAVGLTHMFTNNALATSNR